MIQLPIGLAFKNYYFYTSINLTSVFYLKTKNKKRKSDVQSQSLGNDSIKNFNPSPAPTADQVRAD